MGVCRLELGRVGENHSLLLLVRIRVIFFSHWKGGLSYYNAPNEHYKGHPELRTHYAAL